MKPVEIKRIYKEIQNYQYQNIYYNAKEQYRFPYFLLQKKYLPFYKWSFRALRELDNTLALSGQLAFLLSGNNAEDATAEEKYNTIEAVCGDFVEKLQNENLTQAICGDLEKHAYSVNDSIRDSEIRTMNILTAI